MGYQIWLAAELLQEITCTIARARKNPGLIARASKNGSLLVRCASEISLSSPVRDNFQPKIISKPRTAR